LLPSAASVLICAALLLAFPGNPVTADPPERDDTVVPSSQRLASYEHLLHSAATVGEDPSLARGRGEWDALHYQLTLIPDFEELSISGHVEITFRALQSGVRSIDLDLYDDLLVDRIMDRSTGVAMGFAHSNDVLSVRLPAPMESGDTRTIVVSYRGQPRPVGALGLAFDTTPAGAPTLATVSEPFYARSWWPCKDTALDKATVDLIGIVPQNMFVAAGGTLEFVSTAGTNKLYRWSSDYPMTTYNVSFSITDYVSWTEDYVSPEGNEFPLEFHVFPEHESIARYEFERVGQMIDFFSERFGPYAFPADKYGMAEVVLAGAMEHQTMTSYGDFFMTGDRYYEGIIAHELSHHWWGNLLTLTDWDDLWLHEGLATFCDGLWREHIDGREEYMRFLRQRSAGCCGFNGPISPPTKLFNQTVYQKGAWMLHMLRELVGDTDFFAALRSLTADPSLRYGNFDRDDFIDAFETRTGQSLDWFFDQWLHREGRPEVEIKWSRERFPDGKRFIDVDVVQVQDDDPWTFPFRLKIVFPQGSTEVDLFVENRVTSLRIPVDEWPESFVLDPDQQLLFFDRGAILDGPGPEDPPSDPPADPPVTLDNSVTLSNSPNPFNPRTTIRFALAEGAAPRLRIYDLRGRAVRTLEPGWLPAGQHQIAWHGDDDHGRSVASGTYLLKLEGTGQDLPAHRMTLVR
jgi:aminopeptidase N